MLETRTTFACNLNDVAIVTLTPAGAQHYCQYHRQYGVDVAPIAPLRIQLHELMRVFGPLLFIGFNGPIPFVQNKIEIESMETPQA